MSFSRYSDATLSVRPVAAMLRDCTAPPQRDPDPDTAPLGGVTRVAHAVANGAQTRCSRT